MIREYPPILNGKAENQTVQIRAYLVRLVQSINETFREMQEAIEDAKTRTVPESSKKSSTVISPGMLYEVGDLFLTTRIGDPATLLGYGTWTQVKDRFLLAAGDSYTAGDTGGEARHTLTTDEMPSHNHNGLEIDSTHSLTYANIAPSSGNAAGVGINGSNSIYTALSGGGQAHNNMPPYLVVYVWVRTA